MTLQRLWPWVVVGVGGAIAIGIMLGADQNNSGAVTPISTKPPSFDRAILLGDSHAEGLAAPLGALVQPSGKAFASDFKRSSGAAYWLLRFPITRSALNIGPTDVVVVSLGGNDYKNLAAPMAIQQLAAMLLATGARIVWLEPTRFPFTDSVGVVAAWRASISDVFPTHTIDASLVRAADGVHLVPSSYRAFAQAIWSYLVGE